MFLCDDWLAANKSDGSIRRTLKPSNAFTAANNSSALVRSNMFHRTVDDHMWLSVGMRAKPSSFTRAQRLATCMATLFLAMITNCMFFSGSTLAWQRHHSLEHSGSPPAWRRHHSLELSGSPRAWRRSSSP